jgi:hypothetical protein
MLFIYWKCVIHRDPDIIFSPGRCRNAPHSNNNKGRVLVKLLARHRSGEIIINPKLNGYQYYIHTRSNVCIFRFARELISKIHEYADKRDL